MIKIALTGYKGSGKDYIASILINNHNYKRFAFGDEMKLIASSIFSWLKEDYLPEEKEISLNNEYTDKSPREIWTFLNKLKEIEENIFIRKCDDKINKHIKDNINNGVEENIIITDIRLPEEMEYCINNDYIIIFIDSPKYKEALESKTELHVTESYYEEFKKQADYIFYNNFDGEASFNKFYNKITEVNKILNIELNM